MQYGLSLPNFGEFFSPRRLAELAREAEDAGWDGFFLWDHASPGPRRWWILGLCLQLLR
jgi:alkanesulfonate monooxygenase SsuD/methylene tetrahydromethanopterin reductase-like flavin-dependent oxidoreductase (luciferase family)